MDYEMTVTNEKWEINPRCKILLTRFDSFCLPVTLLQKNLLIKQNDY